MILLVYPPFCTPASPPYSLTRIHNFLKRNSAETVEVFDANLEFHRMKWPEYQKYYSSGKFEDYDKVTSRYREETSKAYSSNNKSIVDGALPELHEEILARIVRDKPDIVAFSVVYSSQAFYAHALISELKKKGIKCVVGGPAVNQKLKSVADAFLANELELLEYATKKKADHDKLNFSMVLDFGIFPLNDYFVPSPVIPLRTCSSCPYKQCAFCTHHGNMAYFEFPIDDIVLTMKNSGQKNFFFIDDMILKKRLLEIARAIKPLKVHWAVQLRPTKELDLETLKILRESGLTFVMWGVESGNDRVLGIIRKGTNVKDIEQVLSDSHAAGIKNSVFIMFGFPTETKEEAVSTIEFLKKNSESIDLVSTSIFGLQKGTDIFNNPSKYRISEINVQERTILDESIKYTVTSGMSQEEAKKFRQRYKRTLEKLNRYPKLMNFFREHMLLTPAETRSDFP